jgi:hypothetical protein
LLCHKNIKIAEQEEEEEAGKSPYDDSDYDLSPDTDFDGE